jgi:hypothetical protein
MDKSLEIMERITDDQNNCIGITAILTIICTVGFLAFDSYFGSKIKTKNIDMQGRIAIVTGMFLNVYIYIYIYTYIRIYI